MYGGSAGLWHAWPQEGVWQYEQVDTTACSNVSARLDASGRLHVAYFVTSSLDLKYAWQGGSTWRITTVDAEGDVGWSCCLALDGAGRPHISYFSRMAALKYAWYDGTNWHIIVVDTGIGLTEYSSLALDPYGRPHISYYEYYDGD
ncbi:MAG: hypothetical protein QXP01_04825, partial [Candidatus Hadarchaeum sp.]